MVREQVIKIVERYLDTIPHWDSDYRTFIQNRIIRLKPQPRNELGHSMKYPYIPFEPIHISKKPIVWKRYQSFLVSEYKWGNHPLEVQLELDKMINKTYKRVGVLYKRVNQYYEKKTQYINSLNNK